MLHKSVQKYNARITKYMNIRNKGTVFCAQMLWLLDGINNKITKKYLFGKALFKRKPMQKTTSYRMSVAPWDCFKGFECALKVLKILHAYITTDTLTD